MLLFGGNPFSGKSWLMLDLALAVATGIQAADHLHLAYDFPLLSEGGIEKLRQYLEHDPYRLVVIDPLTVVRLPDAAPVRATVTSTACLPRFRTCAAGVPSAWRC